MRLNLLRALAVVVLFSCVLFAPAFAAKPKPCVPADQATQDAQQGHLHLRACL